jgi:hypothetical protein
MGTWALGEESAGLTALRLFSLLRFHREPMRTSGVPGNVGTDLSRPRAHEARDRFRGGFVQSMQVDSGYDENGRNLRKDSPHPGRDLRQRAPDFDEFLVLRK